MLKPSPALIALFAVVVAGSGSTVRAEPDEESKLPLFTVWGDNYRTPIAGEGFRLNIFNLFDVDVDAIDRRHVSAWEAGLAFNWRPPEGTPVLPMGSLYYWRHESPRSLLRAEVSGLYNDVFWARTIGNGPAELVMDFSNFTVPFPQSEWVDGKSMAAEELYWGYLRPAFGLGVRKALPGADDNMAAIDVMFEPAALFFYGSPGAAKNFVLPRKTLDLRLHVVARWDAIERNLLGLPHRGLAAGGDFLAGYRPSWDDWGIDGRERRNAGQEYCQLSGYAIGAAAVPGLQSDRHRLIGSVHGALGHNIDRFSATRVGGGVRPGGQEYGSSWRPILPGSAVQEFYPNNYLIGLVEYRFEPVFFVYLSAVASVGYMDRVRLTSTVPTSSNDFFASAGAMLTFGFLGNTRWQLSYHRNTSVVREGKLGGNEFVIDINGKF